MPYGHKGPRNMCVVWCPKTSFQKCSLTSFPSALGSGTAPLAISWLHHYQELVWFEISRKLLLSKKKVTLLHTPKYPEIINVKLCNCFPKWESNNSGMPKTSRVEGYSATSRNINTHISLIYKHAFLSFSQKAKLCNRFLIRFQKIRAQNGCMDFPSDIFLSSILAARRTSEANQETQNAVGNRCI